MKHCVAVGTDGNEIASGIDYGSRSDRRNRHHVVNMDEPFPDRPVRPTTIEPADDASTALNLDAGGAVQATALVSLRDDLDGLALDLSGHGGFDRLKR